MDSITRLCFGCHKEYKRFLESNYPRYMSRIESDNRHLDDVNISGVCLAVQEYQRRHTPIESTMSDYEKYYISLPDRSNVRGVCSGTYTRYDSENDDTGMVIGMEWDGFVEQIEIALRPDYDTSEHWRDDHTNKTLQAKIQTSKTDFIADENRIIPNDRELTDWMKRDFGVIIMFVMLYLLKPYHSAKYLLIPKLKRMLIGLMMPYY